MNSPGPHISFEVAGPIATVTLTNEEKHNCIGSAELTALIEFLDRINGNADIRVLVVTGAGTRTFSAGFDLNELADKSPDALLAVPWGGMLDKLRGLKVPTIAALNGGVFGGGSHLALACDIRIGVDGMVLHVPAGEIGIVYQPSGIKRMTDLLGADFATRVLIQGERFKAQDLLNAGFVQTLADPRELAGIVDDAARNIAAMAPLALAAMKEIITSSLDGTFSQSEGRKLQGACYMSADFAEGVAAKREKRKPEFRGR